MPKRSAVNDLPESVRAELDQRLISNGFAGYEGLSDWLAEQGFAISKSALHRYGQPFEARIQALKMATDQARAIVESSPDDEGAVSEALMRLVQEKLFQVMLDFQVDPDKPLNLASAAKAVAELSRATVTQKKWQAEVRAKAEAAAAAVERIATSGGLSRESVEDIRRAILGVAG